MVLSVTASFFPFQKKYDLFQWVFFFIYLVCPCQQKSSREIDLEHFGTTSPFPCWFRQDRLWCGLSPKPYSVSVPANSSCIVEKAPNFPLVLWAAKNCVNLVGASKNTYNHTYTYIALGSGWCIIEAALLLRKKETNFCSRWSFVHEIKKGERRRRKKSTAVTDQTV